MAKTLSSRKAKKILSEGTAQGHPLTDKQKRFFGAIAGGQKPKYQHSPDRFDPTSMGERPAREEYHAQPENLNTSETPQKAGSARGSIQQSEGTASPRADQRTKSAAMPGEKSGGSKIPGAVDSYGESASETV